LKDFQEDIISIMNEGYDNAIRLLRVCSSTQGFVVCAEDRDNCHRIWGRDGVIMGFAAFLADDKAFIDTFRRTLDTLIDHQGRMVKSPAMSIPFAALSASAEPLAAWMRIYGLESALGSPFAQRMKTNILRMDMWSTSVK
jgi:hypothetical protein